MPYLILNPDTPHPKVFPLTLGTNAIGRGKDNSIAISDRSLSRYHAEAIVTRDGVTLRDLQSLNGTFVNQQKIEQCPLQDGDAIQCGRIVFAFSQNPPAAKPAPSTPLYKGWEGAQPTAQDTQATIVRQFSPEADRTVIEDLIQKGLGGTVLKLRGQNPEQRAVDKLKILLEVSKQLASPESSMRDTAADTSDTFGDRSVELENRLLEKILSLLFEIVSADRAAILMLDDATGQVEVKAIKFQPGLAANPQFYSSKIVDHVFREGKAILTADASMDRRFSDAESVIFQAIHASMCIPLKPHEEAIGVLYVDHLSLSGVYTDEDVEFLTCLASQAAIAIENARLYQKMQEEAVVRGKLERFFPAAVSRKLREEGNMEIVETEVTALFCDISRFTEISSTMQPRQVIEMLNEYFQVMVEEIVFAYEGTLEKYIGDALFAVWGAPYRHDDDAFRAVQAAVSMQWAVRRLNHQWVKRHNQILQVHIGLNTGKVAAGNIGSRNLIQYATIGDTTNVTSRICGVAKPGEVLISHSTLNHLGDRSFPIQALPPMRVKGKDHPLQLYRVLWHQIPPDTPMPNTERLSRSGT